MELKIFFVCVIVQLIIYMYMYHYIFNNIKQSFLSCTIKILYYFQYSFFKIKSEKMKQFIKDNNGFYYIYKPFEFFILNILYAIFSSITLSIMVHKLLLSIIFGIILFSIYIEGLIKYRFIFIYFYENFFIFYVLFQKKKYEEKINDKATKIKKETINITKKEIFTILLMIFSSVIMIYFYLKEIYHLFLNKKEMNFGSINPWFIFPSNNKVFISAFLLFIISIFAIIFSDIKDIYNLKNTVIQKIKIIFQRIIKKQKLDNSDTNYLAPELEKWKKPINTLCKNLGINYVKILVDENLKQPAIAKCTFPPMIVLQKNLWHSLTVKMILENLCL